MLDLQTCKIIDIVVGKNNNDAMAKLWVKLRQPNLVYGQCLQNFIAHLNSNIVFRRWGGENPLLPGHRKPKEAS